MTVKSKAVLTLASLLVVSAAPAQTLTFSNGVQTFAALTNYTVNLTNRCELRVTASATPLAGCTINLNSTDSFLVLTGIKPSIAVSTYLSQVKISGASAVVDSNCRVVQYGVGAVILPHAPSFQPLTVFSGPHFTGSSSNFGQFVYYNSAALLGAINGAGGSFKLKRGYSATFAQNATGSGISKNYVAADGDVEISLLPSGLDRNLRFIYVTPWRWTSKKGIAGDPGNSLLNVQWWYDWNLDQNSSRDFEYLPIRDKRWWPGLGQDWKTRGAGQTANFSTINITGNRTVTLDTPRTIGNLKFSDTINAQTWTVAGTNALTLSTGSATAPLLSITNTLTISAPLSGTNGFTKTGPGTIILTGNNPLSGTLYVDTSATSGSDGITRIAGPSAVTGISTITIRNNNSGTSTLQLDGSLGGINTVANILINGRNTTVLPIENITGTNTLGSLSINVGGGSYLIQSDAGLLNWNGTLSSLATGVRNLTFQGNGDHVVSGVITEGSATAMNVIKTNNGTLNLAGLNSYIGTTTVSGGRLLVDGIIGAGTLSLSSGTTLGGNGVIGTAVTIPSGSTLAPGDNFGPLTVNNNVTLAAGSTTLIEISKGVASTNELISTTNDLLIVNGTLTMNGTLTVSNLAGMLVGGDSFQLFNATSRSGNFSATNLPALPPGMNWNWNPTTGTLSILGVATNSTTMALVVDSGALQLSWPDDHIGWRLQVQTNDLVSGLGTNWFDVDGSALTNSANFLIDPASGNVFYRMIFP